MFSRLKKLIRGDNPHRGPDSPRKDERAYQKSGVLLISRVLQASDEDELLSLGEEIDRVLSNKRNAAYVRLIELHPQTALYHALLGKSILRYGANPRNQLPDLNNEDQAFAFASLNLSLDMDPNLFFAHKSLSEVYEEMIGMLNCNMEFDQTPIADYRPKLIFHCRRRIELSPDDSEAYFLLAENLFEAGDAVEAEKVLSAFRGRFPMNGAAYRRLWTVYSSANHHEQALENILKYRDDPDFSPTDRGFVASAFEACGRNDEAIAYLRREGESRPE